MASSERRGRAPEAGDSPESAAVTEEKEPPAMPTYKKRRHANVDEDSPGPDDLSPSPSEKEDKEMRDEDEPGPSNRPLPKQDANMEQEPNAAEGVKEKPKAKEPPKIKTMEDFGYRFVAGKLRTIEGDEGFKFVNQKHYEELGEAIEREVYSMMLEMGLQKIEVRAHSRDDGPVIRFAFASPRYQLKRKILVLIHGSGVVKAGQWARKLIINESLERGAQLEYIRRGMAAGFGIVVLNYNEKCIDGCNRKCNPTSHAMSEWDCCFPPNLKCPLFVVAHSFGGYVASECYKHYEERLRRVRVICLTDAWFSHAGYDRVINWDTIKKRLSRSNGVYRMYSGDLTHEGTSSAAINSIFHVLEHSEQRISIEDFEEVLYDAEDIMLREVRRKKKESDEMTRRQAEEEAECKKRAQLEAQVKNAEREATKAPKEKEEEKMEEESESAVKAMEEAKIAEKREEGKKPECLLPARASPSNDSISQWPKDATLLSAKGARAAETTEDGESKPKKVMIKRESSV